MTDILTRIVERNRPALEQQKARVSLSEIRHAAEHAAPVRPYRANLMRPGVSFIAEIKRASPSKGLLRPDLDIPALASSYGEHGADCISVITEQYFFQGDLSHLGAAREVTGVPLLRKDFLFDLYQVYEARAQGADAILPIVAILDPVLLEDMIALAASLGMAAQVEVHTLDELDRAVSAGSTIVGINNRDLRDFTVDLATTEMMMRHMPPGVVTVSESGIWTGEDIDRLRACGIDAVHIGESLMRAPDPGLALRNLRESIATVVAP